MGYSSASEILDVPCPACGPDRRSAANRIRPVLRIWTRADGTQAFNCIRCGAKGSLNAEMQLTGASQSSSTDMAQRTRLARRLWTSSTALPQTPGETYLRHARGYHGPLRLTLRYLPARDNHPHALIAAFGLVSEIACGELASPEAPPAIHLTRLAPNALDRLDKIMIGPVSGHPIVLAPVNDGLGLVIAEGIEDALSLHEATGLGAWAAGSAAHLAKLGSAVPAFVACVTLAEDADDAGRRACNRLADDLIKRNFEVKILSFADMAE